MTESILLNAHQSAALLGVSLRRFRDLVKAADFPKARNLGPRSQRWVRTELEAYASALPVVRYADEPPQLAAARSARARGLPPAPAPFGGAV